jgi:hypothetical protein
VLLLAESPFFNFMAFSDWLYTKTDATHRIALDRLAGLVGQWLQSKGIAEKTVTLTLASDYAGRHATSSVPNKPVTLTRQARHLAV